MVRYAYSDMIEKKKYVIILGKMTSVGNLVSVLGHRCIGIRKTSKIKVISKSEIVQFSGTLGTLSFVTSL